MEGLDLSGEAPRDVRPKSAADIAKTVLQVIVGISVAVGLIGWGLPWLTHTSWPQILHEFRHLGWAKAFYLFSLMFIGLWCYTFTIAGSLPGMRHAPALIVNLAGSGISNAMPGGGAWGVAAQYAIFRSWGFNHRNIGTSLIITSIFNLLIRTFLPIIAVVWLLAEGSGQHLPQLLIYGVLGAVVVGVVMISLLVAILMSDASAHAIGKGLNAVVRPILKLLRRDHGQDIEALAVDIRGRIIDVVRPNWLRIVAGIVGFLGVYFFLFRECMLAFGIQMTWGQAFACYALSRMLTMVPLTPGGIGVTEFAAGLMTAFGAQGGQAAAAVLLFAIYSHVLEIPLGLIAAGLWTQTRERYKVRQLPGGEDTQPAQAPA